MIGRITRPRGFTGNNADTRQASNKTTRSQRAKMSKEVPEEKTRAVHTRYQHHELVYLVNLLDYCIDNKIEDEFQETIAEMFEEKFGRKVGPRSAFEKAVEEIHRLGSKPAIARVNAKGPPLDHKMIRRRGTRCVDWSCLSLEDIQLHNTSRKELGLQPVTAPGELGSIGVGGPLCTKDDEALAIALDRGTRSSSAQLSAQARVLDSPAPPIDRREPLLPPPKRKKFAHMAIDGLAPKEASCVEEMQAFTSQRDKEKIEMLSGLVSWLMDHFESGKKGTEEEKARLKSIHKEITSERGGNSKHLIKELVGAQKENAEFKDVVSTLVGPLNTLHIPNTAYCAATPHIDSEWKATWSMIRAATGRTMSPATPKLNQLRDFALHARSMMEGQQQVTACVRWLQSQLWDNKEQLVCTIPSFLAHIVCSFVFADRALLVSSQYPDRLTYLYYVISKADSAMEVKRLDTFMTQMLSREDHFQKVTIPSMASEVAARVREVMRALIPQDLVSSGSDDFKSLCERTIKLKFDLLASQPDYCIRFCDPGTEFNKHCMEAEDHDGLKLLPGQCIASRVQLCLFPMLLQYQAPQLTPASDYREAFTASKRFFSVETETLSLESFHVISKAVVLVDHAYAAEFVWTPK